MVRVKFLIKGVNRSNNKGFLRQNAVKGARTGKKEEM